MYDIVIPLSYKWSIALYDEAIMVFYNTIIDSSYNVIEVYTIELYDTIIALSHKGLYHYTMNLL